MLVSRHPTRPGTARAVEVDGEVCLLAEAADGFCLRIPLTTAAALRLSNDLELCAEQVVAQRDRAKRVARR